MSGILLGAIIEAAGIWVFVTGVAKTGMPPSPRWLAGALMLILGGLACVFGTAIMRKNRMR